MKFIDSVRKLYENANTDTDMEGHYNKAKKKIEDMARHGMPFTHYRIDYNLLNKKEILVYLKDKLEEDGFFTVAFHSEPYRGSIGVIGLEIWWVNPEEYYR